VAGNHGDSSPKENAANDDASAVVTSVRQVQNEAKSFDTKPQLLE
jgi:hypothetical protein